MLSKVESKQIIESLGLKLFRWEGDNARFQCPICGDGEKSNSKRGYFLWKPNKKGDYEYIFFCHNCHESTGALIWFLKNNHPERYKEIMFKQYQDKMILRNMTDEQQRKTQESSLFDESVSNDELNEFLDDMMNSGFVKRLTDMRDSSIPKTYILNRAIPLNSNMFYTDNFYEYVYKPLKAFMNTSIASNRQFKEDPRVFWFIKNRTNEVIAIQGRSLLTGGVRYLSVQLTDDVMIGNLENINIHNRVYATEGYLDSLFLPNAISLNSSNYKRHMEKLMAIGVKEVVIVFDNEPYNREIRKIVGKAIDFSLELKDRIKIGITLLPDDIRLEGKDVNEYVLSMGKNKLLNIIQQNTFFDVMAKAKFSYW